MATPRIRYSKFNDLPTAIRDFLLSKKSGEADQKLQDDYKLADEQADALGDAVMDTIIGDTTLPESVSILRTTFVPAAVSEGNWNAFLSDVLKLEIWPLREHFGDELKDVMEKNEIRPTGWPPFRVVLKPLSYGGAASEIAAIAGFSIVGPQMRDRLRDLVMTKSKGVRIDSQVREVLKRQTDFGGLGLDDAMADKALKAMKDLLATSRILSEDEYADWLAEEARRKAPPEAPKPVAASLTPDEQEIELVKRNMASMPVNSQTVLDEAVEKVFSAILSKPADEYLSSRLKHVVSSRLRDVRSFMEVRQLLERDTKVGGVGLRREAAEAVAKQIEEGYKTYHDRIMEEEKGRLDVQLREQQIKVGERRKQEAEEHAKWYREKVLAKKQEEVTEQQLAVQMRQTLMDVKEKKTEEVRFGEMVPAVGAAEAKSVSRTVQTAVPLLTGSAGSPVKARPEVKVSKATVVLQAAAPMRPKMEDVKGGAPRLSGPIQELKSLTLAEFRRSAKDPETAAQKILQKVETLGAESFDRRVEGIKAWQASALQQVYMTLVAESFRAGKPVAQLAEEKRAEGIDVPSPAELQVIISLNGKLHF